MASRLIKNCCNLFYQTHCLVLSKSKANANWFGHLVENCSMNRCYAFDKRQENEANGIVIVVLICCRFIRQVYTYFCDRSGQGHPTRKFYKILEIAISAFLDCFRAF